MLRDFGVTIAVVIILIALGYLVVVAPCDPQVQKCVSEAKR
jgi:hypothetical protein